MQTWINPYLTFRSSAREAMNFYQGIFGGKLDMVTFGEFGAAEAPEQENLIMHSHLETPDGWTFMAADAGQDFHPDTSIELAIGGKLSELEKVTQWFEALAEGGSIIMPLAKAPWGDHFGNLVDKFGVKWMVNIAGTQEQ
ncbi:VOC family protein [Corynebacterium freiburgense]|uniref:VOC family protein n=1 Tax=Corynebacterium freiburgense TaxID=556548 RepID=UPI000401F06D|nr:VOC family protein [Corynebacterium freiburgense]WJZ02281.1 hypothetical protein CFREI_04925 [Corynebacterium freiburgense]